MTVSEQFQNNPLLHALRRGFVDSPENDDEKAFVEWFLELPVCTGDFEMNYVLRNMFQIDQSIIDDPNCIKNPIKTMSRAYGGAMAAEFYSQFNRYIHLPITIVIQNKPPTITDIGIEPVGSGIRNILFEWPLNIVSGNPLARNKE